MACIDVLIERRRVVVDVVETIETVSGAKDAGKLLGVSSGESDGGRRDSFSLNKELAQLDCGDGVEGEVDGADLERLYDAPDEESECGRRRWCGANKLFAGGSRQGDGLARGEE